MEESECKEPELIISAKEDDEAIGRDDGEEENENGNRNKKGFLGEDELELSLGLPASSSSWRQNNKGTESIHENSSSNTFGLTTTGENVGLDLDGGGMKFVGETETQMRKESQAMRRQEARKKREEKRRLRGSSGGGSGNWGWDWNNRNEEGGEIVRIWWEKQQRAVVRRRERSGSEEDDVPERRRKVVDNGCGGVCRENDGVETASFMLGGPETRRSEDELSTGKDGGGGGGGGGGDGLRFLVPCLDGNGTREKNGFHHVVGGGGGFRPYPQNLATGGVSGGGGRNGDGVKEQPGLSFFSLGVSDHHQHSSSGQVQGQGQGRCNSDIGNIPNSTSSQTDQLCVSRPLNRHSGQLPPPNQSITAQPSAIPPSSHQMTDHLIIRSQSLNKPTPNSLSPTTNDPSSSTGPNSKSKPIPNSTPNTTTQSISSTPTRSLSLGSSINNKSPNPKKLVLPPKPPPPPPQNKLPPKETTTSTDHNGETLLLSQMPCVSTTGNAPNGKTITGFLYRYNKSEVSIVCVCHGTSFTPAGFVEHAGGVDVEHPLRHITVVPFALG